MDRHAKPPHRDVTLSPLPVRLGVWIVLVAIAVLSIWWIDRRAVQRMHEISPPSTSSINTMP